MNDEHDHASAEHHDDAPAGHNDHHDDWFRHSPDEPHAQAAHGEINPTFIIGFLSAVIAATFGVVVLFLVYFNQVNTDLKVQNWEERTPLLGNYAEKRANWTAELGAQPEWADPDQTYVTVPLDVAMQNVIESYNAER